MAANQPPQNYGYNQPGAPGAPPMGAPGGEAPQGNGLAVAALVVGILGVVLFFLPFVGLILAILGVVFGASGMNKSNRIGGKGKGMAIAGLATGAVGVLLGLWMLYAFFTAVKTVNDFDHEWRRQHGSIEQPDVRTVADLQMPAPAPGILSLG